MNPDKPKQDRRLTVAVVVLSLAGIIYFGYRAISDDSSRNQENPFEYNIEHFKKTDSDLHTFREVQQINLSPGPPAGIAIPRLFASRSMRFAVRPAASSCVSGNRPLPIPEFLQRDRVPLLPQ